MLIEEVKIIYLVEEGITVVVVGLFFVENHF